MDNRKVKIRRYFDDINRAGFSDFLNGFEDFVDSALDGNTDFLVSTFEEYAGRDRKYFVFANYNDFTKKCMCRFIREFEYLFPGILTPEEIVQRISKNLKGNIVVAELTNDNENTEYASYYDSVKKLVYLNKNNTSAINDAVLFHEFIHCITINKERTNTDLESDFVTETIPSLMQNMLERRFNLFNSNTRSNIYVTNYAEQFAIVCGLNFFKEYVQNYRDLSNLFEDFPVRDYPNNEIFHNFVVIIRSINKIIRMGGDTCFLKYLNSIFEFNMVIFLNNIFNNHPELSTKDKLIKMTDLLNIQKTPDIDLYKGMLDEMAIDENLLSEFPDLKYIQDGVLNDKVDPLLPDKVNNFNAAKYFGFTKVLNYSSNTSLCKHNVLFAYQRSYYSDYLKNERYYNLLYRLKTEKSLDFDDYSLCEVYGEQESDSISMTKEMEAGVDYINAELADYRKENSYKHDFMFRANKEGHTVFIEKNQNIRVYSEADINKIMEDKKKNGEVINALAVLFSEGIDSVYTSDDSKDIIGCTDKRTYVFRYKPFKRQYEMEIYPLNPLENVHNKGACLNKKI